MKRMTQEKAEQLIKLASAYIDFTTALHIVSFRRLILMGYT